METIDKDLKENIYSPQCSLCKNLINGINRTCLAFPSGIPIKIWDNDKKHREVIEGQEGDYIFEKENIKI